MEHSVELLHTGFVTHDVKRFVTTRPDGLDHEPGQGVEVRDHPFLVMLRKRAREGDIDRCSLHFSNKTPADVIRRIDRAYLETIRDALDTPVYLCGPPDFVESLHVALVDLGVDEDDIVLEE